MDQGVAAVWAGIAGLAGAGIGGGLAAWGSWIGGRKTVEAAERAEERAAKTGHQQWQRERRYDAYRAFMELLDEMNAWTVNVRAQEVIDLLTRLRGAAAAISVLGPEEVAEAAASSISALTQVAFRSLHAANHTYQPGEAVPSSTPAALTPENSQRMADAREQFQAAVHDVLGAPPA